MSSVLTIPVSGSTSNAIAISSFTSLGFDATGGINGGNALLPQYAANSGGTFGYATKYNDNSGAAISLAQSGGGFGFIDKIPPGAGMLRLTTFSPVTSSLSITVYGA